MKNAGSGAKLTETFSKIVSLTIFYDLFFVFIKLGRYGNQNIKTPFHPQFHFDFNQTFW